MPHRVERREQPENPYEFIVVYYFLWTEGTAAYDVFGSDDESEAQAEAQRMNSIEQRIEQPFDSAFGQLRDELKLDPLHLLGYIENWCFAKRALFKEGVH